MGEKALVPTPASGSKHALSDAQQKEFFEAAAQKAKELKEKNVCLTLSDQDAVVFAKDKLKTSTSLYYKTASAKARALLAAKGNKDALVAPGNLFQMMSLVFYKLPYTLLCGGAFYVAGCAQIETSVDAESSKSDNATAYVAASGCLDAKNDVLIVEAGLEKIGFVEGDDGIWRSKL